MTIWRIPQSSSRARRRERMRRRDFCFEALEHRRVLDADALGGVTGIVFLDSNENGAFDAGEEVANALVQVFSDTDGDALFDPAIDQLVAAANTNNAGSYEVRGLATGDYFIVQPQQVVGALSLGPQVSAPASVNGGGLLGEVIDEFQTLSDAVIATEPVGTPATSVTAAMDAMGGQRDLVATLVEVTGGAGMERASISAGGGLLAADPTNFAIGNYLVEWDGVDLADDGLNPIGLGGVDLTSLVGGPTSAFEGICLRDVNPDKAGLSLVLRVYTDADNFSEVTFAELTPDVNQDLYAAFAGGTGLSFAAAGTLGPADFTNVGAITLEIIDAVDGTDFAMGQIRAAGTDFQTVDILNVSEAPLVDIEALTNGNQADDPMDPDVPVISAGSVVIWSYEVTNTGPVEITTVTVTDDQLGAITNIVDQGNGDAILDPGEVWIYQATGTAIDGSYSNLATVVVESAAAVMASDSDTSNYRGGVSMIDIEKLTNGNQADDINDMDVPMVEVGSTVTWTYVVTNMGSFDLTDVAVSDDQLGMITNIIDNGNGDDVLQPSESWTFEASGTAVLGEYENVGTASAVGEDQATATDSDLSHYIGFVTAVPAIDIEVATNGVDADTSGSGPDLFVGDLVTLTYVVTNPGDVPLENIQVTDNNGTPADDTDDFFATFTGGDLNADGMLDVDETWQYQAFRVATLGDFETIGTVSGFYEVATEVTDSDPSHHRGIERPDGVFGWHNASLPSDVNDNGIVVAADALAIINELVLRTVSDPITGELEPPPPTLFYDVNDDGFVAPVDAINVINDIGVAATIDLNGSETGVDVSVTLPINATFVHLFDQRLTIGHDGNSLLASARLQIQDFVTLEESLGADTTDTSITASFDDTTGTLSLTGADTLTNYLRVLRTVTLDLATAGATRTPIFVTVVLHDGFSDSNTATVTVEREVVNVPPTLDLNGSEVGTDVSLVLPRTATSLQLFDQRLTIQQGSAEMLESAVLTIQGYVAGEESLSIDTTGTSIVSSFNSTTGELQLTGTDTTANYETALRTVFLDLTTAGGTRTPILIDVVVNDGSEDSNTASVNVNRQNVTPALDEITDVMQLAGSPLHIPLLASDNDGDALTFVATSDNALVSTFIPNGNRSARISVSSPTDPSFVGGEMVFELFEQRAPRATERIIELAGSSFYDGVLFHRVINGFVIQGGDPTGTGNGGSNLGEFDDQFHPDLQHNRRGVLAMAKTSDDTNDSQFFVTEVPARSLDFQHTIFGQLITGEEVREEISNVPIDTNDRPVDDVVIDSFEIFLDDQNGVLMLSAPEGTTAGAMITVTVTDGHGGTAVRMFNVTVEPDTVDNQPYLADIPQLATTVDTPLTYQLVATDLEGDSVVFVDESQLRPEEILEPVTSADLTYSVDPDTGLLTVTPTNGLTGTHRFTVGVIQVDQLSGGFDRPIDLQVVEIVIG